MLVGAAVDIRYTMQAGIAAVLMIFVGLMFRGCRVSLCMLGTKLNKKERLFCVIAYLPKATVQAAIGSVPLAMGLPCGQIVLSVAVLAILITAPLGAAGMDRLMISCWSVHKTDWYIIMSSQVFPAPAFMADFPPVVPEFHHRTHRVRLKEIWAQLTKIFSQNQAQKDSERTLFMKGCAGKQIPVF